MPFDPNDAEQVAAVEAAKEAVRRETAATLAKVAGDKVAAESATATLRAELEALKASGTATADELKSARERIKAIDDAAAEQAAQAEQAAKSKFDALPEAVRKAKPDGVTHAQYVAIVDAMPAHTPSRVAGDGPGDEPTEEERALARSKGFGNASNATILKLAKLAGVRRAS